MGRARCYGCGEYAAKTFATRVGPMCMQCCEAWCLANVQHHYSWTLFLMYVSGALDPDAVRMVQMMAFTPGNKLNA